MKLQTTLNIIRAHSPCADGWAKLLKSLPAKFDHDAPITFAHILKSNGLDDALWALRSVLPEQEKERDREARLLACEYAESVLHIFEREYPKDNRPRLAVETVRRFALDKATAEELAAARDAAWDAAWPASWAAAWDASWAAAGAAAWDAAWAAARDAAGAAEKQKQIAQFKARFCEENSP
jgi:hypothetical protein